MTVETDQFAAQLTAALAGAFYQLETGQPLDSDRLAEVEEHVTTELEQKGIDLGAPKDQTA